ncbi:MAG: AAA family ATPase [Marinisporobacter sp.]|jgi:predicted ATPase|nr:AAA family ATPase [Marinisporobacter sp.]
MQQRWSLNVEEFGKIKKAKIEISPLILFIGDNNSGKSYLMSLLWGLLTLGRDVFNYKMLKSDSYEQCDKWLADHIGKEVIINDEIQTMFINLFNDLLNRNKKLIVNKIYNYPIEIKNMFISDYERNSTLKIQWKEDAMRYSNTTTLIKFPYNKDEEVSSEERSKMINYICWKLVLDGLTTPLFPFNSKRKHDGSPIYLPASRTGFMLTYKTLVQDAISRGFSLKIENEQYKSIFTLPVNYFLQDLVKLDHVDKSKYGHVGEYIEENLLQGKVLSEDLPVPNYTYRPKGLKKDMPLHITSSLVSELMPIILFLKSSMKYNVMIIEEPEAHIHIKYQLLMARAIIRLVNAGLPVWITTHSDTILQQINNSIKLNNNPDKVRIMKEYNYEEEDLLFEKDVRVYQFENIDERKTKIEKLEQTKMGFPADTFNDTLINLLNETAAFEGDE